jgi:hypothetical protein
MVVYGGAQRRLFDIKWTCGPAEAAAIRSRDCVAQLTDVECHGYSEESRRLLPPLNGILICQSHGNDLAG